MENVTQKKSSSESIGTVNNYMGFMQTVTKQTTDKFSPTFSAFCNPANSPQCRCEVGRPATARQTAGAEELTIQVVSQPANQI